VRIFVVHDARGNIRSFAVPAPDMADDMELEQRRGRQVSQLDVPGPDRIDPRESSEQLRRLRETLKRHRVKRGRQGAALVPRSRVRK
jgi:hypothetical protein